MKDVGTSKLKMYASKCCEGSKVNLGPKLKQTTSTKPYVLRYRCIYVGLYGNGFCVLIRLPCLLVPLQHFFAYILSFDVRTSSFIFIEHVFYYCYFQQLFCIIILTDKKGCC